MRSSPGQGYLRCDSIINFHDSWSPQKEGALSDWAAERGEQKGNADNSSRQTCMAAETLLLAVLPLLVRFPSIHNNTVRLYWSRWGNFLFTERCPEKSQSSGPAAVQRGSPWAQRGTICAALCLCCWVSEWLYIKFEINNCCQCHRIKRELCTNYASMSLKSQSGCFYPAAVDLRRQH